MAYRNNSTKKETDVNILKMTPTNIQIKANLQNFTFPKSSYSERFLIHLISKKNYDAIIESVSKVLSSSWMKKRENDKISLPPFVTILAVIAVICALLYLILIYYSTTVQRGDALMIVSMVCVVLSMGIAFTLSIYNFSRKIGTFKTIQDIIKEDINEVLKSANEQNKNLNFQFNSEENYLDIKILEVNSDFVNWKPDDDIVIEDKNVEEKQKVNNIQFNQSQKGSKTNSKPASRKGELI